MQRILLVTCILVALVLTAYKPPRADERSAASHAHRGSGTPAVAVGG
jgi:hypothetical protein